MANKQSAIPLAAALAVDALAEPLLQKPAPKTASFTFICENEAFKDEGYVPEITAEQYQRIKAILGEVKIILA